MSSLDRIHSLDNRDPKWSTLLQKIVERVTASGSVHKILLFGSLASGKMTEASDIDLLVVVPDSEDTRQFRMRIPSPLSSWPTDLIVVTESRFNERKDFGGVILEAHQGGIELYPQWTWERNP